MGHRPGGVRRVMAGVCAGVLLIGGLTGCGARVAAGDDAGAIGAGEEVQRGLKLASGVVYAPGPREVISDAVDGAGRPTKAERRRVSAPVAGVGESRSWTIEIDEATVAGWRAVRSLGLREDATGVHLEWMTDVDRGTTTRFDPPLLMMPGTLEGEAHRHAAEVRAERVERPGAVTQRGTATVVADVSRGEGAEIRFTSTLTIVLGPATIERRSVYEIEGSAIVRERESRVVSTRLFTVERRERVLTPRR